MNYSLKLKDPRWQKKRLEILDRDQFTCTKCGDDETELHVHHHYYVFNKELWDYDDDALSTLCGPCHREETERINIIKESLRGFRYDRLKHLSHIIVCATCFNDIELKDITKKCTEILDNKGIEWEYVNENDK